MPEENKFWSLDLRSTIQIFLIIAMTTGGWVWTASKANSEIEDIDSRVYKLEGHIESQAKITNQIAIDLAKLSVESGHQQQQTREMKGDIKRQARDMKKDFGKMQDLLQILLIEVRK